MKGPPQMTMTRRTALATIGGVVIAGHAATAQTTPFSLRDITHTPDAPVLGNPEGDVTIVEFFDYQCPFCRSIHPDVIDMVARDGNIRLVMKDWPIFGEMSVFAHKVGLAAVSLGKYRDVHMALMGIEGRSLTDESITAAAAAVGVDAEEAAALFDREADTWMPLVWRNEQQAVNLGLQGTPAFLIGQQLFAGAAGVADLEAMVAEARRG